jgi:small subunit ribosomal protein S4
MARYIGPVCRFCRREGLKLFLKAERCYTDKCAFERTSYPPGQHGTRRSKFSEYGQQLREKQKVRRLYGLQERQFRLTFARADRMKGVTGETLLRLLEQRLDNMVYRLGFASTRAEARQIVGHRHVTVDGRIVNIPSYVVKPGQEIALKESSRKCERFQENLERSQARTLLSWLELDRANFTGRVTGLPIREELTTPIEEQLIVEFYSR